jgi:Ca2+-binding EF-hand superfamily protein
LAVQCLTVAALKPSEVANMFDRNNDGELSWDELKSAALRLSLYGQRQQDLSFRHTNSLGKWTLEAAEKKMEALDTDGDGALTLDELTADTDTVKVEYAPDLATKVFEWADSRKEGKLNTTDLIRYENPMGATSPFRNKMIDFIVDYSFEHSDEDKDGSLNYDEYRHAGDGWFDLMKSQKSSRTDVEELSNRRQFFHVDTNRDETLSRDEVALLFGFVFRIASSHKTAKAHRMARLIWKMNADTEKSKRRFAPVTLEEISDERATKKLEHHVRVLLPPAPLHASRVTTPVPFADPLVVLQI